MKASHTAAGAFIVVGALAGTFALGLRWSRDDALTQAPPSTEEAPSSTADPSNDLELASLKRRLAQVERKLTTGTPGPATEKTEEEVREESAPESRSAVRERQKARMVEYEAALEDIARNETPNAAWSSSIANSLSSKLPMLPQQMKAESVQCGATLCTIRLTHADRDAHANLLGVLNSPESRAPGFDGPALIRRHEDPAGGYRTTIFLARAGERLPAIEMLSN